jgi:hypothetical protein
MMNILIVIVSDAYENVIILETQSRNYQTLRSITENWKKRRLFHWRNHGEPNNNPYMIEYLYTLSGHELIEKENEEGRVRKNWTPLRDN